MGETPEFPTAETLGSRLGSLTYNRWRFDFCWRNPDFKSSVARISPLDSKRAPLKQLPIARGSVDWSLKRVAGVEQFDHAFASWLAIRDGLGRVRRRPFCHGRSLGRLVHLPELIQPRIVRRRSNIEVVVLRGRTGGRRLIEIV